MLNYGVYIKKLITNANDNLNIYYILLQKLSINQQRR